MRGDRISRMDKLLFVEILGLELGVFAGRSVKIAVKIRSIILGKNRQNNQDF